MRKATVRIAVAIDENGEWNSCGWGNVNETPREDGELIAICMDCLNEGEARYFIEAEILLPEPVSAKVVSAVVERDLTTDSP